MGRVRVLAGLAGVVTAGGMLLGAPAARAANTPTFRDCSAFVEGFDPDFVEISGVVVGPGGRLTVAPSQQAVPLTASESSDPGDSSGHVTLKATVTSAGLATQTVSGAGAGRVVLQVPLPGPRAGRTYTISWAATFDNGNHACPSAFTPDNTPSDPHPFVLTASRHA